MADAGFNTKATHKEMKKALMNEGTMSDKLKGGDCSMMCLMLWFAVVVFMFFIDMQLGQEDLPYHGNGGYLS